MVMYSLRNFVKLFKERLHLYALRGAMTLVLVIMMGSSGVEMNISSKFLTFQNLTQGGVRVAYHSQVLDIAVGQRYADMVEVFSGDNVTLRYRCFVNRLTGEDRLLKIKICFYHWFLKECRTLNERSEVIPDLLTYGWGSFPNNVSFRFFKNVGVEWVIRDFRGETTFQQIIKVQCSATNRQGTIISTPLELKDIRYLYTDKIISNQSMVLNPKDGGTLICTRDKGLTFYPNSHALFNWSYCTDDKFEHCHDFWSIDAPNWPVEIVAKSGNLHLTYIPDNVQKILQNKRLKCSIGNTETARYLQKVTFERRPTNVNDTAWTETEGTPDSVTKVIQMWETWFFFLPLKLKVPENATLTWKYRGRRLALLSANESNDGKCFLVPFSSVLMCKGPFPVSIKDYPFVLTARRGRWTLQQNYYVELYSNWPMLSDYWADQVFAVDGMRASAYYGLHPLPGWMSGWFLYFRGVNVYPFRGEKNATHIISSTIRDYQHVMAPSNISLKYVRLPDFHNELIVEKAVYRDPSHQNLSSDYHATMCAWMPQLCLQTIFTVLPRPDIERIKFRSVAANIIFSLVIKNKEEILDLGAKITCGWKFNGRSIKELLNAMELTGSLTSCQLTVKTAKVRAYKNITCTAILINPAVVKSHVKRKIFESNPRNLSISRVVSPIIANPE